MCACYDVCMWLCAVVCACVATVGLTYFVFLPCRPCGYHHSAQWMILSGEQRVQYVSYRLEVNLLVWYFLYGILMHGEKGCMQHSTQKVLKVDINS